MKTSKPILIRLPEPLLAGLKKAAKNRYQTVSGFIREALADRLSDEFSEREIALIERGRRAYRAGKGKDWRSVRRA